MRRKERAALELGNLVEPSIICLIATGSLHGDKALNTAPNDPSPKIPNFVYVVKGSTYVHKTRKTSTHIHKLQWWQDQTQFTVGKMLLYPMMNESRNRPPGAVKFVRVHSSFAFGAPILTLPAFHFFEH